MMVIRTDLRPADLSARLDRMWALSAAKIRALEAAWDPAQGSPVSTVKGRYTARGWTAWTQGFRVGAPILQFDATGEREFLDLGRDLTITGMTGHLTHMGVHDHGFNNMSTYGNLWRLIVEGRIDAALRERELYELALKVSGAVQARRWTRIRDGRGFIHSFNGPHSLFVDTIRSLRSLAVAHSLGHELLEENDARVSLLERLVQHAHVTAEFNVYRGEGRDVYDVRGRVAHESLFDVTDGRYRCPSTQQGYSPFSTWTRGLAWFMLGSAELLEYLGSVPDAELEPLGGRGAVEAPILEGARATCDFYLANTPADGIPHWDTGAPGLALLAGHLNRPADPFNPHEPVDASAAAIAAQGLLRLGHLLHARRPAPDPVAARTCWQAGLTVLDRLLDEPYLATDPEHQGLLLHCVYHRPNGWDHVPSGARIPYGEACMWGDYHLREAALYVQRFLRGGPYHAFFGAPGSPASMPGAGGPPA